MTAWKDCESVIVEVMDRSVLIMEDLESLVLRLSTFESFIDEEEDFEALENSSDCNIFR